MGRYFGRAPRYSRQEIEAQAKEEVEARVGLGRPPAEDWQPLVARLAEMDQQVAAPMAPDVVAPTPPVPAPAGAGADST